MRWANDKAGAYPTSIGQAASAFGAKLPVQSMPVETAGVRLRILPSELIQKLGRSRNIVIIIAIVMDSQHAISFLIRPVSVFENDA